MCRLNVEKEYYGKKIKDSFNTSNVSVEFVFSGVWGNSKKMFQYFKCVGWMTGAKNQKQGVRKFQYFKCVGWIYKDAQLFVNELLFQYFKCVGWI